MDIMEFDRRVGTAVDVLVDAMRFETKQFQDQMMTVCMEAQKENLPEHLVIATVAAQVQRLMKAQQEVQAEFAK